MKKKFFIKLHVLKYGLIETVAKCGNYRALCNNNKIIISLNVIFLSCTVYTFDSYSFVRKLFPYVFIN